MKRPLSVTIVCWLLIAFSFFTLIPVLTGAMNAPQTVRMMQMSPIPMELQFALLYAGIAVSLVSAVCMLGGKRWARTLYIGWSVFGFIISFGTSPAKILLVPGLIVFAVIAFFLYRPKANAYFASGGARQDA